MTMTKNLQVCESTNLLIKLIVQLLNLANIRTNVIGKAKIKMLPNYKILKLI